jgi:tetratricopeptide (TPR) repeat protein
MSEIKKKQSEVEDKQEEVKAELEKQRNQTIDLQTLAESAKEQAEQAEQAAYYAKASVIFAQALNERLPSKAVMLYDDIINLFPKYSKLYQVYSNRGILKEDMGDYGGAMSDFSRALSINPNDAGVYSNRGALNWKMGNKKNALSDFNQAISIDYNVYSFHFNCAGCYRGLAKNEKNKNKRAYYIAKAKNEEKIAKKIKTKR